MYNSKDRGDIKSLHVASSGVGAALNHRDASSSKPIWKNASPTLIRTPNSNHTNRDSSARYGRASNSIYGGISNPVKLARMQDNLYAGNPTAKKTVLAYNIFPDTRPPKRPKIDSTSYASSSGSGQRSKDSNMSSRLSTGSYGTHQVHLSDPDIEEIERPSASSSKPNSGYKRSFHDADLVVVDSDDDTDKGVVVSRTNVSSPDPLVLEPSTSTIPHRRKPDYSHPSDIQMKSSHREAIPSMAGPSKHAGVKEIDLEDSDSIHSFPSDDKPSPDATAGPPQSGHASTIPIGIVQQGVRRYEGGPSEVYNAPRINLIDKQKGHTLTSRMKAKPSSKGGSTSTHQQDPIATSASGFTKSQIPLTKHEPINLPLRAWSYGMKLFISEDKCESPPCFSYNPKNFQLEISCRKPYYKTTFQLDRDVDSVTVTQNGNQPLQYPVVIQFRSTIATRKRSEELHEDLFKAGSKGQDGKLTFQFYEGHKSWSLTWYITLLEFLRKAISECSSVIPSGAAGIWEQVERAMELKEEREIRTKSTLKTRRSSSEEAVVEPSKPRLKARPTGLLSRKLSQPVSDASLRRSGRQSTSESARQSLSSEPDELILMYPPSGTGALNIMKTDLNRLQPGEFLNDTLIEFGLKLWLNELRIKDPEFADQIHVFSSFFYKKLNRKNLEEGYQSVKKWTSKFDLFSKKYIIVPINEHMHWYLAIICDPEHTLLPPLPPTPSKVISTRRRTRQIDDIEKHPLDSTPPQGPADDDVRMEDIPRSPSRDAPDEEMKELDVFKDSCSISSLTPDGSKPVSVSSSDGGEKLFTESSDVDIPDLNYPSPQLRSRSMEIDIDVPEHDVISLSSKKDSSLSIISDSSTSRVDELSEATTPNSRAISASSFYGSASNRKGKRKASYADVVEVIDESVDDQRQEEEVDEMLTVSTTSEKEPPVTCVFTLDSLGSRHPQALKTLKQYLKMEAKDKKNAGECREPFGKNALVPMQPNYCDCGVYLLHFAMTFMKDPERHCRNVREKKSSSGVERKVVWEESDVGSFRENLASRIQELSKVWKAERAAKEEGKNKGSEHRKPSADQDKAVSSDSEVDIVEDISAPEVVAPPKPKQKPAARMRG